MLTNLYKSVNKKNKTLRMLNDNRQIQPTFDWIIFTCVCKH